MVQEEMASRMSPQAPLYEPESPACAVARWDVTQEAAITSKSLGGNTRQWGKDVEGAHGI